MKRLFIYILLIVLFSCQNNTKSNNESAQDQAVVNVRRDLNLNHLIIDKTIIANIEEELGKNCETLNLKIEKFEKNGKDKLYTLDTGVVFKFIEEDSAHIIFQKYHDKVFEGGNYLFLTNMDFDKSYKVHYDIVILNCKDQFKLIDLLGTNGLNYDLFTDDVIKKLKEWHQQVEFKIEVVDGDRIQAYMNKSPENLTKFAADVYEFCPDVIDQGYGSMEEMLKDYRVNKYFWLWWD